MSNPFHARAFYAKCNAAGSLVWLNYLPIVTDNPTTRSGSSIIADGVGNCYIVGRLHTPGKLFRTTLDTLAGFVLRTNGAGRQQWVRQFNSFVPGAGGGWQAPAGLLLAPKPAGGCVVWGRFNSALYYGPNSGPNSGAAISTTATASSFVSSIDTTGNLLWVQQTPMAGPQSATLAGEVNGVAADAAGNCYATGTFGNDGFGLVKYNSVGLLEWLRTQDAPSPGLRASTGVWVAVDSAQNVTVVARPVLSATTPALPTFVLDNLQLNTLFSVIHFNAQGQPEWATSDTYPHNLASDSNTGFLAGLGLGVDRKGTIYYTANVSSGSLGPHTVTELGHYTLVGQGLVIARISTQNNTLPGRVYLDTNGNGRFDAGETGFTHPLVVTTPLPAPTLLETTDSKGFFTCYTDSGSYQLQLGQVPAHYTLTQPVTSAYSGHFRGYGNTDSLRLFGLQPIPSQPDLRVTLTPYNGARPGFPTRYHLTVENVGTTTVASGTATLTLAAQLLYISSNPSGSRTGQTLTWSFSNLAPQARRDMDILFSLPTNVPVGTVVSSSATAPLTGDVVPADNTSTLSQTVVGSIDPNAIEVNYTHLTQTQVAQGQPLDYTVHFQNIGTDTAFAVIVTDTLDSHRLNLSSLQLIAQSHNCQWTLSGRNTLTVRFLNILLPYRNVNVIASQGFVVFRVQPNVTLPVGDIIPNHASIVFDFNAPVRTNIATTAVLTPAAVLSNHTALAWDTYPNPASGSFTITADLPSAGTLTLQLLDALGRPVQQHSLVAPAGAFSQALDVSPLAPGLYVLRLRLPDGTVRTRQVVRE